MERYGDPTAGGFRRKTSIFREPCSEPSLLQHMGSGSSVIIVVHLCSFGRLHDLLRSFRMGDGFTLPGFLRFNHGDIGLYDDNKAEKQASLNCNRIYHYEPLALMFQIQLDKS